MLEISAAGPADAGEVVSLWDRAGGPTRHAGRHAEVASLLARDPDALLVARLGGALAGTLIVGWDGWRCHLYRLAVDERFRRHGVAGALVEAARARAAEVGAVRIDAMVAVDNAPAVALWESCGFERDDHDARWSLLVAEPAERE